MNSLITASQLNQNARANCGKYFTKLKKLVEQDVGFICCDRDGNVENLTSSQNVLNTPGSQQKMIWNKRIIEKKYDQIKQRKSKKLSINDVSSSKAAQQVSLLDF